MVFGLIFHMSEFYFKIDGTDFSVDNTYEITINDGRLHLDVSRDQHVFDEQTNLDDSSFNWAIYPPRFCICNLPIPDHSAEFEIIDANEYSDSEVYLYFMQYFDVVKCKIQILNSLITIDAEVIGIFPESSKLQIRLKFT